uniref:ATPase subunit 8 n=1 Tax=Balanoglossus clavigerus TaxID=560604 RepID=D3H5W5_BALCL|nr:ATP synthase F0 subunit 8 [Balanoglossus clavigerus]CBH40139.1 ATPase subunit 8 [Balanoglossus clavigerus]
MPQLNPDFWALNFITVWLLVAIALATTASLQLPLPPSSSAPHPHHTFSTPQWLWT